MQKCINYCQFPSWSWHKALSFQPRLALPDPYPRIATRAGQWTTCVFQSMIGTWHHYQSRPTQLTQSLHYIQSRQLPALQHFTWLTQLTQLTHLIQTSQCDSANFFDKPRNCGLVTFFCSTRRCHTWCPCSGGTLVMNQLKAIIGNNQSRTSCNAGKLLLHLLPRNRQNVLEDVSRLRLLHQIPE